MSVEDWESMLKELEEALITESADTEEKRIDVMF